MDKAETELEAVMIREPYLWELRNELLREKLYNEYVEEMKHA